MPDAKHDMINLSEKEALIVSLRQLSQKKIICGSMGDFREKLRKWRRYNETESLKETMARGSRSNIMMYII